MTIFIENLRQHLFPIINPIYLLLQTLIMAGIYLAFNSNHLLESRTQLLNTLVKSGLQSFPSDLEFNGNTGVIQQNLDAANASLHILGLNYGALLMNNQSIEHYQYLAALEKLKQDPEFRLFVWFPFNVNDIQDEAQKQFIAEIRNNIVSGINFSNTPSAIQLADDLRLSVKTNQKQSFDIKDTDVFLVYNQLDDFEAAEVADMLSDIIPVEKLNIVQDSDLDYSEFCVQQIGKSKLAVVYFKESADWALPFTQQIWKKIGGASSHTPILLIGDEDPETNMNVKFKAPKVVSLIVAGELIPLEIKVQFDKVLESAV